MFLEKYGYLMLFIGETITIIGYLIRFLFFLIFPEAYQNFIKRHQGITKEEAEELIEYLDQLHTNNTDHGDEKRTGTEENAKGRLLILRAFLIKKKEQARGNRKHFSPQKCQKRRVSALHPLTVPKSYRAIQRKKS